MTTAAVQTIWADLIAATLADAGVTTVVVSPGSRSTPLVAALAARAGAFELVTIIDERAAAFYALGAARATGEPVALVCTSGTAAAHYLPALVEASLANVPLVALTANRPPELHACGAAQTIDQTRLYGAFVRGAFALGTPVADDLALGALRRTLVQAIALARGPHPGPVHVDVPLRKPLEPAPPASDAERALAQHAAALAIAPAASPRLAADPAALDRLAAAITAEPDGVIVAGALPLAFGRARELVFELAARTGYPLLAEAASQLRFGPRPAEVTFVDHLDLIPIERRPRPAVIVQLGAQPVAASWSGWITHARPARWVLAGPAWHDPEASAREVVLGDVEAALAALVARLRELPPPRPARAWRDAEQRASAALEVALAAHAGSEAAVVRAALDAVPDGATLQLGNSLPIRVVDHVCAGGAARGVLAQRGAAGIDGLIASAAGATRAGRPVLLVLGDVSFAHDLGGLLAARHAAAPLAILVIDNGGGQIFAGLPVARAPLGDAFEACWLTPPAIDPAAVARALGARAETAATPAAAADAVARALAAPGVTVIHAPVSASGAHDVRRTALELYGPGGAA